MKKVFAVCALAGGLVGQAHAAAGDVDLTVLTNQFKPESIVTGILAVAAVLMTVYVAKKGIVMILGMVRG